MARETREARRMRIDAIMREQGSKPRSAEETKAFLHLLDCQHEREIARAALLEAEYNLDAARYAIDRWEHRAPEVKSMRTEATDQAQRFAYYAQAKGFQAHAAALVGRICGKARKRKPKIKSKKRKH